MLDLLYFLTCQELEHLIEHTSDYRKCVMTNFQVIIDNCLIFRFVLLHQGDLESGRTAYDSFFGRYPYCYGYWKKYADLEKRKGTQSSTLDVSYHDGSCFVPSFPPKMRLLI